MALSAGLAVSVQVLIGSTWTSLSSRDVIQSLRIQYGLSSNGPTDCLAATGECEYTLRNDAGNSGGVAGLYSPLNSNVLSGWTFGLRQRVVFSYESPLTVSSLTRSSSTATVTTSAAHGLATGDWVEVAGAAQTEYNIIAQITVTGTTTFTYTVSGTPTTPATGTIQTQRKYIKFTGKIDTIDPAPGIKKRLPAKVRAYDSMRDLYDTDVLDVAIQIDQDEATVIGAALSALPSANQPIARTLDTGLDLLPYALDDLGRGVKCAAVLQDILVSSYGLGFTKGDGTFRYISRNTRATTTSSYTITDADIQNLKAPSSLANVFNKVRTTNHPRTIDASDVVLYALTGTAPVIAAGETQAFEGAFRDPDDARRTIGAVSTIALVSGTDYAANSVIDGSGTDLTSSLTVTSTVDASRVVFSVTNTSGSPAYLVNASGETTLQIRGKGAYDNAPRTFETSSGNADRLIQIDMPYGDNDGVTQQIGSFILSQYEDLSAQIESVTLIADSSNPTKLRQVLAREPGDVITVSETVTGLSAVNAMILSCTYGFIPGGVLTVTWGLGPVIDATPPNPPTSLTATVTSDASADLAWSMGSGAAGAQTLIYQDGLLIATTGAGVTALSVTGLARATTVTFTARHILLSLVSNATAGASARPVVAATGGTVTTPGDGYKYHTFTANGNLVISTPGRIDWMLVGGGGGGGGGGANGSSDAGGGGGGGGGVDLQIDNQEPAGTHAVVIGGGGTGGTTDGTTGQNGTDGGDTTYRTTVGIGRRGGYGGGVSGNNGNVGSGGASQGGGGGGGGGTTGGAGGIGTSSTGGAGLSAGANNAAGGGGGGGAGNSATNATSTGGAGGVGLVTFAGTFGAGGIGGRGALGQAAGGANTGKGGGGGDSATAGYNGGSGKAVFRYPI